VTIGEPFATYSETELLGTNGHTLVGQTTFFSSKLQCQFLSKHSIKYQHG